VAHRAVFFILILTFIHGAQPAGGSQEVCPHDPGQVYVPGGRFTFGSTRAERELAYTLDKQVTRPYGWYEQETRGQIEAGPFCIDQTPVTQREYERFVQVTQHRAPDISNDDYLSQGFLVHPYTSVQRYRWQQGSPPKSLAEHPVVLISVADAAAYCGWRGRTEGRRYRLPTELEWEKAARGTNGQFFPWGNEWDSTALNSEDRLGTTSPVGQFPRGESPYGVLDMAGNTFEWTATPWAAPTPLAPSKRSVLKGCSWDDRPGTCRAAMRHGRANKSRHILIGFRCVSETTNRQQKHPTEGPKNSKPQ